MFGATLTKWIDNTQRVREKAERASKRAFAKAAFRIGGEAIRSIETSDEPAREGQPPHTRRQRKLPRAIKYAADSEGAVIGPVASKADQAGQPHEFGGRYKGTTFPARPFMLPALEKQADSFAGEFAGSIGQ